MRISNSEDKIIYTQSKKTLNMVNIRTCIFLNHTEADIHVHVRCLPEHYGLLKNLHLILYKLIE